MAKLHDISQPPRPLPRTADIPLAALLFLAACATAPRPLPPLTEAQLIREAFTNPVMQSCDELTCYYLIGRQFRVRSVSCAPIPRRPWHQVPEVACTYERQPMPKSWGLPIPVIDGEPPPEPKPLGPWEAAKTSFMVHDERRWSVTQDPYWGESR